MARYSQRNRMPGGCGGRILVLVAFGFYIIKFRSTATLSLCSLGQAVLLISGLLLMQCCCTSRIRVAFERAELVEICFAPDSTRAQNAAWLVPLPSSRSASGVGGEKDTERGTACPARNAFASCGLAPRGHACRLHNLSSAAPASPPFLLPPESSAPSPRARTLIRLRQDRFAPRRLHSKPTRRERICRLLGGGSSA